MWKSNDYTISLSAILQRNQRGGILTVLYLNKIGSKVADLLGVMAIEREKRWGSGQVSEGHLNG